MASHELKTPLTTLRMNLLLLGEKAENLTARQHEILATAVLGCHELASTIDELLRRYHAAAIAWPRRHATESGQLAGKPALLFVYLAVRDGSEGRNRFVQYGFAALFFLGYAATLVGLVGR